MKVVRESAPGRDAKDLVQRVFVEALEAFERAPPNPATVFGWISVIARRVVADHLVKRKRRSKYEGDMPDLSDREPVDLSESSDSASDAATGPMGERPHPVFDGGYDPRAPRGEDLEVDGFFALRWLTAEVRENAYDRETLAMLLEHTRERKTYLTLAAERGIAPGTLSSRIFEFKKKYVPRYRRERNRTILILLFGGIVIAFILWLLSRPDVTPSGQVHPMRPTILDRVLGNPLPVSHPPPNGAVEPDGG